MNQAYGDLVWTSTKDETYAKADRDDGRHNYVHNEDFVRTLVIFAMIFGDIVRDFDLLYTDGGATSHRRTIKPLKNRKIAECINALRIAVLIIR